MGGCGLEEVGEECAGHGLCVSEEDGCFCYPPHLAGEYCQESCPYIWTAMTVLALIAHLAVCAFTCWKMKGQRWERWSRGTLIRPPVIMILLLVASLLRACFWAVDLGCRASYHENGAFSLPSWQLFFNLPTILFYLAWVLVLVLWQHTLVLNGVSLEKTARHVIMFIVPYTGFAAILLCVGIYINQFFLWLFYVCMTIAVCLVGIAGGHTLRTLSIFMVTQDRQTVSRVTRALKDDHSVPLVVGSVKTFLNRTIFLSLFLLAYLPILLLLGDRREKSTCSTIVFWATWEVVSTVGSTSILSAFTRRADV